jgi:hypothetical protein
LRLRCSRIQANFLPSVRTSKHRKCGVYPTAAALPEPLVCVSLLYAATLLNFTVPYCKHIYNFNKQTKNYKLQTKYAVLRQSSLSDIFSKTNIENRHHNILFQRQKGHCTTEWSLRIELRKNFHAATTLGVTFLVRLIKMQDTKYVGTEEYRHRQKTTSITITRKKKLKLYQVMACPRF